MANYAGTIIAHALSESKENHTPSIKLQIQVFEDLETKRPAEGVYTADLWLTEKAAERSMATLRALGYDADTLEPLNNDGSTGIMVGTHCEIKTKQEEYNGKTYEKVEYVNAPGSFANRGVKSCDESQARRIAARYDAILRNTPRGAPAPQAPRQSSQVGYRQTPPPPTANDYHAPANADDDLPW